jgi:nicotinate-nucleotide--dimethylbenzimidazole phosphoribosyltransferase
MAGHVSAEGGAPKALGKDSARSRLLDLGMKLGEASGAALAAGIVKAAVNTSRHDMATFASAGVSGKA